MIACRDEATRTPDHYVPNVVRYQLRYIPIFCCLSKHKCHFMRAKILFLKIKTKKYD